MAKKVIINKQQTVNEKTEQKVNEEAELLKAQLVRALADYDNFRKRVDLEKVGWEKIAGSKVVLKLLPVLDMLIDAQKHLKDSGLEIVIGEFRKSLYDLGVEEIKINIGDDFNPLKEEVVEIVPGEKENTVAEVLQMGWKIKNEDFIIRPARVNVVKNN